MDKITEEELKNLNNEDLTNFLNILETLDNSLQEVENMGEKENEK